MQEGTSRKFYVYTYAYPHGDIFYVGKGQGDRSQHHLHKALHGHHDVNKQKQAVIKSILATGQVPSIEIVATFEDEKAALMYEWALINMTCYADRLTNMRYSKGRAKSNKPIIALPILTKPICIQQKDSRKVYRDIVDLNGFAEGHAIKRRTLKDLIEGKERHSWHLVAC